MQALKNWRKAKPELFHKRVNNHTGLDRYPLQTAGMTDMRVPLGGLFVDVDLENGACLKWFLAGAEFDEGFFDEG